MDLPDFLQLSDEERTREERRQDRLRRDFNSRVRLSSVQQEAARAVVIEPSLRDAMDSINAEIASLVSQGRSVEAAELAGDVRSMTANRLAENLAQQGRFLEAVEIAVSSDSKDFYSRAADAVYLEKDCDCGAKVEAVEQTRIALPRYRVIKEIYSIKAGEFGFLTECNACGNWTFQTANPMPPEITETKGQPNDLTRLKV